MDFHYLSSSIYSANNFANNCAYIFKLKLIYNLLKQKQNKFFLKNLIDLQLFS